MAGAATFLSVPLFDHLADSWPDDTVVWAGAVLYEATDGDTINAEDSIKALPARSPVHERVAGLFDIRRLRDSSRTPT